MKLAVSNIAWNPEEQDAIIPILRDRGVGGIEVAPTKLWPDWAGADAASAESARRDFEALGFAVPSMQAILFGKPDLSIFAAASDPIRAETLDHLALVARLAGALGARALVFGSPRNRDRGDRSPDVAFEIAAEFFREAGRICARHDTWLCLEPLPDAYGSNFATSWKEAARLVQAVDTPGFGLHLDTACIHMGGDDPAEAVLTCDGMIRHFHVSEPQLADLSNPTIDHKRVGEALKSIGYGNWISLEMRRPDDPAARVAEAVDRVLDCYGDVLK